MLEQLTGVLFLQLLKLTIIQIKKCFWQNRTTDF